MSQYFCSIVDNALCNPAQRMYFDLGEYRYGLTVVGEGNLLYVSTASLNQAILGMLLICRGIEWFVLI